ncbi:hypothetical protein Pla110_45390 [Polystyrenella longa]|uniref:GYF domain-containing protein n=1 Tax=Polystyrenella longa TaxID=2528007 RepID=A0A518CU80_9PLAN|nr:GYF domain-containing protein [Polystyrenella longa]QDU82777.1 hypothetical protein Pla110_45390 [Polystyrenella longa]
MSSWYVKINHHVYGPMSVGDLSRLADEGGIDSDTLIRKGENGKWYPPEKVKGLSIKPPSLESNSGNGQSLNEKNLLVNLNNPNLCPCPDCDHLVSFRAISCPSCGCVLFDESDLEAEDQYSHSGIDFATSHDISGDGIPDLHVFHNTEQIREAIYDFREAIGIPDDETQWKSLKKWGWLFTIGCFIIGFVIAQVMTSGGPMEEDAFVMGLIGGTGIAFVPLIMTIIAMNID